MLFLNKDYQGVSQSAAAEKGRAIRSKSSAQDPATNLHLWAFRCYPSRKVRSSIHFAIALQNFTQFKNIFYPDTFYSLFQCATFIKGVML